MYESLSSAAARLGTSPDTVKRWIDSGKLAGIQVKGGNRAALSEDVDRLARERLNREKK